MRLSFSMMTRQMRLTDTDHFYIILRHNLSLPTLSDNADIVFNKDP